MSSRSRVRIVVHRVEQAWSRPFIGAIRSWSHRSHLFIRAHREDGVVSIGESSPLPEYSPDTLEDVQEALTALENRGWMTLPGFSGGSLSDWIAPWVEAQLPAGLPSARFGLETALWDLASRIQKVPIESLLGLTPKGPVPAAVVVPSLETHAFKAWIGEALRNGVRTFKFKISPDLLNGAIERAQYIRTLGGPSVRLRLDANQSFETAQAEELLHALKTLHPEFVEEPCRSIASLASPASVPLALDESLRSDRLDSSPGVSVWVLKPMVLGGVTTTLDWVRRAKETGCQVVLSHLFDGPVAHAMYAVLATGVASPLDPGLGLHPGLEAFLPDWPSPRLRNGWIHPSSAPGLGLNWPDPIPRGES
jgi:o-succinylbenzoate synthase